MLKNAPDIQDVLFSPRTLEFGKIKIPKKCIILAEKLGNISQEK